MVRVLLPDFLSLSVLCAYTYSSTSGPVKNCPLFLHAGSHIISTLQTLRPFRDQYSGAFHQGHAGDMSIWGFSSMILHRVSTQPMRGPSFFLMEMIYWSLHSGGLPFRRQLHMLFMHARNAYPYIVSSSSDCTVSLQFTAFWQTAIMKSITVEGCYLLALRISWSATAIPSSVGAMSIKPSKCANLKSRKCIINKYKVCLANIGKWSHCLALWCEISHRRGQEPWERGVLCSNFLLLEHLYSNPILISSLHGDCTPKPLTL